MAGAACPCAAPSRVPHAGTRSVRAQGDGTRGETSLFPACASYRVIPGRPVSPEHHWVPPRRCSGTQPPLFEPLWLRRVRAGPHSDPQPPVPAPFPHRPPACSTPTVWGRLGKPTAGTNPRRRFGAAMPTPLPWRWAPNGRPPGEAKMPKKTSDAVAPKNHWPEAGSPWPLLDPGAAHGTASKLPRGAGGCNKAGKNTKKK